MTNTNKVKVEFYKCFWLRVKGNKNNGTKYIIFDEKIIPDFLKWLLDENIDAPIFNSSHGMGNYNGAFWPEDIEKVLEWFEARGVGSIHQIVKE